MYRLVREKVPGALVFQAVVELGWLLAVVLLAGKLGSDYWSPTANTLADLFLFGLLVACVNLMFGFYRRAYRVPAVEHFAREALVFCVEFPIAYLLSKAIFGSTALRHGHAYSVLSALLVLMLLRQLIALAAARSIIPKRVLVLGTGEEALALDASIAASDLPRVQMVGFCSLGESHGVTVPADRIVTSFSALETTVQRLRVDEIVVAVHEQRGGVLPLKMLLDCRLGGVQVTSLSRFVERVHRRLPIESLKASWLIYGRGFDDNVLRRVAKRLTDVLVGCALLAIALPLMALAATAIILTSGGPVLSRQPCVGFRGQAFMRLAFRTAPAGVDAVHRGGAPRATALGRVLRRARIDELPVLLNVLRGDMSLVGPQPERPERVAALTATIPFYAIRHSIAPGVTGWAQVNKWRIHRDARDKSTLTCRRLEYDLYYVKNHSLLLDARVILNAVGIVVFGAGRP